MRFNAEPRPDVFAAVMATGIVSVAAADHYYRWITAILDVIATAGLVVLTGFAAVQWFSLRRCPFGDARNPDVSLRLFTFVAACAVVGARHHDREIALWILGAVAALGWLVLASMSAVNMSRRSWRELRDSAHGVWELASVATSGLAIVGGYLSELTGWRSLWFAALAMWIVAIAVYGLMTTLIVGRAVVARLAWEADSWILMGGLAIATLAGDTLHGAAPRLGLSGWLVDGVRVVTVATWVAATLWIPVLLGVSLRGINQRAGVLGFRGAWWGLVFPLGMYSSASFAMAGEMGWRSLQTISLVFFWIAVTAWVVVTLAGLDTFRRAQTR